MFFFKILFAIKKPLAIQACRRYPPVGASQSIISPATYTLDLLINMKSLSIELKLTPPAVEIHFLIEKGFNASAYHAGLEASVRKNVQNIFIINNI